MKRLTIIKCSALAFSVATICFGSSAAAATTKTTVRRTARVAQAPAIQNLPSGASDLLRRIQDRLNNRRKNQPQEDPAPSPEEPRRTPPAEPPSSQPSSNLKQRLVDLVNAERRKEGLPALKYDNRLAASAQGHAEDMRDNDYFSHTSQDGRSPTERMQAAGYKPDCRCSYAYGENIAMGQKTPEEAMRDWMNSPGHRRNILGGKFDDIGIGIDGYYWVQNFGAIRSN